MSNEIIPKDEVLKIAKLSRLYVDEARLPELFSNLNSILDYVKGLDKVDVSGVEPMSHAHEVTNVFRPDILQPHMPVEDALKNAADKSGRFFRVPIIVE